MEIRFRKRFIDYLEGLTPGGAKTIHLDTLGDSYFNAGNVGIGIINPPQKLSVDGNIETLDGHHVKTDKVRARDTDGLLLVDDDDKGIFVKNGGRVGVGTTNPDSLFTVSVNTDNSASNPFADIGNWSRIKNLNGAINSFATLVFDTAGGEYVFIKAQKTGGNEIRLIFATRDSAGGYIEHVAINQAGLFTFLNSGGLPGGSMYQDDVPTTVAIGTANTDYIIDGFTVGRTLNTTFQNNREFKILTAGWYDIAWSASVRMVAGVNQEIECTVGINGVRSPQASAHIQVAGNIKTEAMSGVCQLDLSVDDLVSTVVRNESFANNVIVEHANLKLSMVGG